MKNVAEIYKDAEKNIVISDNPNIHKGGPSERWTEFNKKHNNKFQFVYTPTHASWLNQVEVFFLYYIEGA